MKTVYHTSSILKRSNEDNITAESISKFLNAELYGPNITIKGISSLESPVENTVCFATKAISACDVKNILVLTKTPFKSIDFSYILLENPRLAFANVLRQFFNPTEMLKGIAQTAVIHPSAKIHATATVGAFSVIGPNVEIGKNSCIKNHVVVGHECKVGDHCIIGSGSIIGEPGFGLAFDVNKRPVSIPHLGGVIIKDYVEIGAKCTIDSGTIHPTFIEDNVKIDNQVHVAHNCSIGSNSIITACVEISGSVKIGKRVWVGPNSSIIQKVRIGDDAVVGIASVVCGNIQAGITVLGSPAKKIKRGN